MRTCPKCEKRSSGADQGWGVCLGVVIGGALNTIRSGGTNLLRRHSSGSWICGHCDSCFSICPACDKLNYVSSLNVGSVIKCGGCSESFVVV